MRLTAATCSLHSDGEQISEETYRIKGFTRGLIQHGHEWNQMTSDGRIKENMRLISETKYVVLREQMAE
jgi:hypothetical protein